jgi:hypothetical protein
VGQVFLYGRGIQRNPWIRKHFYPIVVATLVTCALGVWGFLHYFGDVYGVSSSLLMDVLMAALFIGMFFNRPDLRGLSYLGAWLMMLGNVCGFLFIYFWFPMQFADGHLIGYPSVAEPRTFHFLTLLYVATTALNALYVYFLRRRRRELRAGVQGSDLVVPLAPMQVTSKTAAPVGRGVQLS